MPTEALWKGEPTIAGAVGGIPNQDHPQTHRVLAHSVKDALFRLRHLLTHPDFAKRIGANGREHVKENFLMTTGVKRSLLLFRILERREVTTRSTSLSVYRVVPRAALVLQD
jgi:trehalose synthase